MSHHCLPILNRSPRRWTLRAVVVWFLGVALATSQAASVGVNFIAVNQGGGTPMDAAATAGVEPQANWNNMPAAQTQSSPVAVHDDSGNATSATLIWNANTTWRATANASTIPLFDGYLDDTSTDTNSFVLVENVPYPLYDVYLYFGSDGNDRSCWLQINGDQSTRKYARTASNPFPGYIEATATSEAAAFASTYAHFVDVSGDRLFVEWNRLSNNSGLHGMQIVSRLVIPGLPVVANLPASSVTATSAQLHGEVLDIGTNAPTVAIYYGPADGATSTNAWANRLDLPGTHGGSFSGFVEGLSPKTVYYYRARAMNQSGASWAGSSASWVTLAALATVENLAATSIQAFTAQVGARVTDTGGDVPNVTLYYGRADGATTPANWEHQIALGQVEDQSERSLAGLEFGSVYYFRAAAENEAGISWAPQSAMFLTATPAVPVVENRPATTVTGTSAKLNGQVVDSGFDPPFVTIYYGTSDGGTNTAMWEAFSELGTVESAFARTVGGLTPLTQYYYRAHAGNAAGASWAPATASFTTPEFVPPTVVINEVHYDESDKTVLAEFIELYNPATNAVDLSDWRLEEAVEFTFPPGTVIASGAYLVIAQDPPTILSKFGVGALGPWTGKLRNRGETIELRDAVGQKVDEVDYRLGFPWPTVGDPPNYSIELFHPELDNELGGSWHISDGSLTAPPPGTYVAAGSVWKYFKGISEPASSGEDWRLVGFDDSTWFTGRGTLGYGEDFIATDLADMQGAYSTVYFRQSFQVDDPAAVTALVLGVQFDDGVNVWINGTLVARSSNTTGNEPFNATVGNIGESYDYVEFSVANPSLVLLPGENVLAAQVINTSLAGSSDCFFDLRLADRPGTTGSGTGPTPGAVNSVFTANAPPQMRQVDHSPLEPKTGEDVFITVKVTDPDGVASVVLAYQVVDPGDYFCRWLVDSAPDPRYEDPAEWTEIVMNDQGQGGDALVGDDVYSVTLPGTLQMHRRLVRYRIVATDGLGVSRRAPYLEDEQPNFAYFVYDGVPGWSGRVRAGESFENYSGELMSSIATYHLLSRSNWVDDSQFGGYGGSSYRWPGTLVYDGEVYDHIRYRPRGGVHRFQYGKNFWKFDFNRGRYFQARDNYGRKYDTRWHKLNFSSIVQQVGFNHRGEQGLFEGVGFRLFELAGVEACKTHYVQFRIIDEAAETGADQYEGDYYGLFLAIEQMDGQFLDEHGLPDGNLYKIEGHSGASNNQGPTQVTDRSDVSGFINTYRNSTPTEPWWRDNLDLERYFSYRTIVEGIHHYDIAYGKNYFYFHNPETGKFQVHPWDLDLTWANNMFGDGNHDFKIKVANNPAFNREFQNRVREIMDLLYNAEQAGMLIDEIAQTIYAPGTPTLAEADRRLWDNNPRINHPDRYYDVASTRDFAGMVQLCKNYVISRGNWMRSNLLTEEATIPDTPTITYVGPPGFPADALSFVSSTFSSPGGDAFGALRWRLAKVTDTSSPTFDPSQPRDYEIESSWDSGDLTTFLSQMHIPALEVHPGDTYRVRVKHRDASGRWSHWSDPIQLTAGFADVAIYTNNLMITEVMYHPAPPTSQEQAAGFSESDFEFVELRNVGDITLDLTPLRFTKGIDFDFDGSAVTSLGPGAHVLVVRRQAAFEWRYGAGWPVAGEYYMYAEDNLDNAGEQLKLSLAAGTPVQDFVYDDIQPWPTEPDGAGPSLVLNNPSSRPDHALPSNWRASRFPFGSPGYSENLNFEVWKEQHFTMEQLLDPLVSGNGADPDMDGDDNETEYMRGGNPWDGIAAPKAEGLIYATGGDDYLAIRFRRQTGADDLHYRFRVSNNLSFWLMGSGLTLRAEAPVQHGDGTETVIYRLVSPISEFAPRRFLELQIERVNP